MKDSYICEDLGMVKNKLLFTGALFIGDFFICRSTDNNKKRLKSTCYTKAVGILTTFTVDQIMRLKDIGKEALRTELTKASQEGRAPVTEIDPNIGESIKRIEELQELLKKQLSFTLNIISRVEQAVVGVKNTANYIEGEGKNAADRNVYEGSLYINGIHFGIARNINKKLTKSSCYEMAFNRLMSLSADVLVKGLTTEEVSGVVTEDVGLLTGLQEEHLSLPSLQCIISTMALPENQPFSINFDIVTMDELKLNPALLYRRCLDQNNIICELYLGRLLLSSGQGETKVAAKRLAYENAEELFNTTKAEKILAEHKVLKQEDQNASDVLQYVVVTNNNRSQSNIQKLKVHIWPTFGEDCKDITVDDIIIQEHTKWIDDRYNQAFGILLYSCSQNGLIMEWDFEKISNSVFECLITIQGKNLATARTAANSKASAKHLAAAHVLYQLYETKPVIVADTHDPSPRTVTLAELQKKADELRMSGVAVPEIEEREMSSSKTEKEGEEINTENNLKGKVDKYIVHALQKTVEEFFVEDTLKDLFIGPDVNNLYVSVCGTFGTKYLHVRRSATPEGGNCYYKSYHPKKILELLRKNNGQMGKYHTLKSSEVPKSSDLALELASSQRTYNAAVQQQQQTEKNKQMALMHIQKGASKAASTNKRKFPPQVPNQFENNTFGPSFAKKVKSQGFQGPNQGYQKQNQGFQHQNQGFQKQNQGFQQHNQGFQKQNKGFQQQNQGFQKQNKGFQKTQGFQQQTQGYKKQAQGLQQRNQGFQKKSQGFQMQNPGFQMQNQGFKGQNQGFQGQNQDFQGQNQGFQMQNQGPKKQKRGGFNQYSNQQFQQSYDQGYDDGHFSMDYGAIQEEYYEIPSTISQMNQGFTNPQHGVMKNKRIGNANRGPKRMLPLRPSEEFERAYEDFNMDQGAGYGFSQGEYQDTSMAMMEGDYTNYDSNEPAVGWDNGYSDQGFMQDSGYQQFRVPDTEYYNMV
ncbi:hypothetical protein SNE40_000488 [Patella caerulea]